MLNKRFASHQLATKVPHCISQSPQRTSLSDTTTVKYLREKANLAGDNGSTVRTAINKYEKEA